MSTTNQTPATPAPSATPDSGGAPAAAAPQSTPQATPSTPPAGASATDWTTGFNEDLKGYVQNKGFKDPVSAVESYRNLEKLVGAPKEKLIKLPDNMEDANAMSEVYAKLGRPSKAEEYKIEVAKEGGDPEFVKFLQSTFFENGLTVKQAHGFIQKWNELHANTVKAQGEKQEQAFKAEQENLKKEWGMAFDQKISSAKKAAREFGVDAAIIDKLESVMGYSGVMKLFDTIGSKLGDPNFHGAQPSGGSQFAMTPEAARNKIAMLRNDPGFAKRLLEKDSSAIAEWNNAHRMANPE